MPPADIPNLEPELTRAEMIKVIRDLEWKSPRRELQVLQSIDGGEYFEVARISGLNRPPYYTINLLQYLTDNADYPVAANSDLAFRAVDSGFGPLSGEDEFLIFCGGVSDSPESLSEAPGGSPDLSLGTGSLVEVSNTAILVAPEQVGRRYLAISVQRGSSVWLGVGSKPREGAGILLTGKASSYEIANYYGKVYAIASEPSTISVTLVS